MDFGEKQNRRRSGPSPLIVLDVLLLFLVLAIAIHAIVVSRVRELKPALRQQFGFWQQRAGELCDPTRKPVAPALNPSADPLEQLESIADLNRYSQEVWKEYEGCQEPISIDIREDILHFKLNKFDEYEGDWKRGFETIRSNVDQYVGTHNQIYVIGHTDERNTDEYNYKLSYLRALEITGMIQRHLTAHGKEHKRDYEIYPVGMGEARLVARQSNEPDDDWHTRCRRIELQFRSLPPGSKSKK